MLLASKPAYLYICSGLSWSINLSGNIIDLNFKLLSIKLLSNKYCETCDPKPPIEPSSIEMIVSWSLANCQIVFLSKGLANLASNKVKLIPFFF